MFYVIEYSQDKTDGGNKSNKIISIKVISGEQYTPLITENKNPKQNKI